jgi:molybdate transport repressor ModE-like protein
LYFEKYNAEENGMKPVTKLIITDDNGIKFFGEGPARLLRGVEKQGSLRSAAMAMEMAYTKALKLVKQAEVALGYPLITRTTGGKDGGGSVLTPEGRRWLFQYEAYRDACVRSNQALYRQFFPKIGCVIMASGLGKRFGGNKLMADFRGKPMILRALQASESLKIHRVVVTRHQDIAKLCKDLGVDVILHDMPHRSDTVRLGLEFLGNVDGCLFLPGDQPLLRRETVEGMVRQWHENKSTIMRPFHNETPGSPVLFPQWAFPELLDLPEGKGGGWVIKQHPECVKAFLVDDPYQLTDADTPETLELLRSL